MCSKFASDKCLFVCGKYIKMSSETYGEIVIVVNDNNSRCQNYMMVHQIVDSISQLICKQMARNVLWRTIDSSQKQKGELEREERSKSIELVLDSRLAKRIGAVVTILVLKVFTWIKNIQQVFLKHIHSIINFLSLCFSFFRWHPRTVHSRSIHFLLWCVLQLKLVFAVLWLDVP